MKYYPQFNKGDLCRWDYGYAKAHGYDPDATGKVLRIISEDSDGRQILSVEWDDVRAENLIPNSRLVWAGRPTNGY